MLHRCLRWAIVQILRLFYPRIEVQGRERVPHDAPIIFVLNHPNGLLDPLVLMAALRQPIAFLAKSTFFANPFGRVCMAAFGALPVYRQQDRGLPGGAGSDAAARNEATFAACRALLRAHRALALFPEGTTHSTPTLLPLRTGAARIALGAEAEADWQLDLRIVPVGLWYQNKTLFRSSVLLVIGEPWTIAEYRAAYTRDERAAVHQLTEQIKNNLDRVVLQAEHAELLNGMPLIAAWTAPDGPPPTLAEQHARAAALLADYQKLAQADPQRLNALTQQARRYGRTLRALGIDDPWALELPTIRSGRLIRQILLLIVGFPFALAGFTLSYGPYRLAGVLTPPLVGHYDTLIGTGKLIIGSILVLLGWIVIAIVIGALFGAGWGALLFALSPALGYAALRWGESWHALRESVTYSWLRAHHRHIQAELIARRQRLTADVLQAVALISDEVPERSSPV